MAANTARSRRPAGDHTGRQAEQLTAQAQEELAQRAGKITTVNGPAEVIVDDDALIDVTNAQQPVVKSMTDSDVTDDEKREMARTRAQGGEVVEVGGVEVGERTRLMRVAEKIDPVIGWGPSGPNEYHFEPGKLYKVPEVVYDHLDEIGYVYH